MNELKREGRKANLESLQHVELPLKVIFIEEYISVNELLKLSKGSILKFQVPIKNSADLVLNGHHIATGIVVQIGEKWGLEITQIAN